MTAFEACFAIVVDTEKGLSLEPADPGNWTGGRPGAGTLKGSKWGISAKEYPQLDIANLTVDDARTIYRRDYWTPIHGDDLPPPLALIVFDAAVNAGVPEAVRWLQLAVGVAPDSAVGPATLAAVRYHTGQGADVAAEALARRLAFTAALPLWHLDALGWARRLCRLPFQSLTVGG